MTGLARRLPSEAGEATDSRGDPVTTQTKELRSRDRFDFGRNWSRLLPCIDEERILNAEQSLRQMLEVTDLRGQRFLDIGSGSGLFSLAARRLGARVHSFDIDRDSVACTLELRDRYRGDDVGWTVEQGSIVDRSYMASLGQHDVVYAWGVLHHTGQMWQALENAQSAVAPGGKLFIAIYNDAGSQSERWRWIKRSYNALPRFLRLPFTLAVIAPGEVKAACSSLLRGQPGRYVALWTQYRQRRGMSYWRDIVDWVGGYPYEVAKPEEIFDFYRARGFSLMKLRCGGVGLGCNEFVFHRLAAAE
jgi:2-polyprenyl-6-hydroxyphenyl methylase/3-demethylubiquinone-9 3-methyltransferase